MGKYKKRPTQPEAGKLTVRDNSEASSWALVKGLWPEDGRQILGALVIYKLGFFALVYLAIYLFPPSLFSQGNYQANFVADRGAPVTNVTRLATWDGQHYLFLSERGWLSDHPSSAFYPMVPWLIKAGGALTGNNILGGIILCNLLSLLGFYVFFVFARRECGPETGQVSLLLMLTFPGALFFQFLYSEAPSIFFLSLFFYFLMRDDYRTAGITAFFLPLCRAVGVFAIIPFVWRVFSRWRKGESEPTSFAWTLSPLMGWALYFFIVYLYTGNPFEMFRATTYYRSQASVWNIIDIPLFVKETFSVSHLHDYEGSLIDRLWMIPIIPGLFLLWKTDKTYLLYTLATVIVPVTTGRYTSFTRYVVLAFPLFLVYAEMLSQPNRQLHKWIVVIFFFGLQILMVLRYLNNYWAG
jgi:hypothetical protein